jgi:hypothetical protein
MFKNTIKIVAAVAIAIVAMLGLSACGGSASAEPTNLNGTWVYTSDGYAMVAEVKDDTILVNLKLRDDIGLYWAGDFKNPAKDGDVFTSKANVEQLKASLFGSQDSAKEFKIVDGKITFQFTIMGTTRTIELEKNSSSTN